MGSVVNRRTLILLSPLVVIATGHVVARVAGTFIGVWAFVPVLICLWALFWGAVILGGGDLRRWLGPARGGRWWSVGAVAVGLLPLPIFLQHRSLLNTPMLVIGWLLFAAINPISEEVYWRGVLLDATRTWPAWTSVLYSSFFFALNHPLTLGVHSIANRHPATFISTLILGVVWAVAVRRAGTLRYAIIGHTACDLLNLSVAAFLNLYLPRGMAP